MTIETARRALSDELWERVVEGQKRDFFRGNRERRVWRAHFLDVPVVVYWEEAIEPESWNVDAIRSVASTASGLREFRDYLACLPQKSIFADTELRLCLEKAVRQALYASDPAVIKNFLLRYEKYVNKTPIEFNLLASLRGITVSEQIDICDRFTLMPPQPELLEELRNAADGMRSDFDWRRRPDAILKLERAARSPAEIQKEFSLFENAVQLFFGTHVLSECYKIWSPWIASNATFATVERQRGASEALSRDRAQELENFITRLTPQLLKNGIYIGAKQEQADRSIAFKLWEDAISSRTALQKIFFAISGLEALLSDGQGELSHKLSQRVAILLSGSCSNTTETFQRMKELYKLRSKFVHGDASIHQKDVSEMAIWANYYFRASLTTVLQYEASKSTLITVLDSAALDHGERSRLAERLSSFVYPRHRSIQQKV